MKSHHVKIKSIEHITHDVLQITTEKPSLYNFEPGQGTDVSINKGGWINEKSPFTFTSLPENVDLEFIIKTHPEREGLTDGLLDLQQGDELILHEVFGTITYQGEGVFIAGGAGITPFVSIFRQLESKNQIGNNKLIFANKTKSDIILQKELNELLGNNFINILSDEVSDEFANGEVTENFLKMHISNSTKHVYVCGPPTMVSDIKKQLSNLGVEKKSITLEGLQY